MTDLVVETVDQKTDADHLAVPEGMRETEKGGGRHAPGNEIVAGRNIEAERPAGRQQHHQHKNRDEEKPGEIAGEKIESIEKNADHDVCFSLTRILSGSNSRTTFVQAETSNRFSLAVLDRDHARARRG